MNNFEMFAPAPAEQYATRFRLPREELAMSAKGRDDGFRK
ncbi:hypothetical protein OKW39_002644 [Paraburkholderia sp. MM6662-R1]